MYCKTLFLLIVLCLLFTESQAQRRLQSEIAREVTVALFDKDLTAFANQLAKENAATTKRLLFKLEVFARAGHRVRVHQTLNQIAEAKDFAVVQSDYTVGEMIRNVVGYNDLEALKIYYEKFAKADSSPKEIIERWEKEGDIKGLESWLAAQSKKNPSWQYSLIELKIRHGKAEEVLNQLADDIKNNPKEIRYAFIYLSANESAKNIKDVSWLETFYEFDTAYDNYNLGRAFLENIPSRPQLAVKYLEKSLTIPFTKQDDAKILKRYSSSGTGRSINYEKQFRYSTKQALAKTYNALGQYQLAQPLAEELVKMKDDADIYGGDVNMIAGAAQGGSGFRVVESKILSEEEAKKTSVEYWLERVQYYTGRKEYDTVVQTYQQALSNFPYKAQEDPYKRIWLIRNYISFMTRYHEEWMKSSEERLSELGKFLRNEFNSVQLETEYARKLAEIFFDEDRLDDFCLSFFVRERKDALAYLLKGRPERDYNRRQFVQNLVENNNITEEETDFVFSQAERSVTDPASLWAYEVAEIMVEHRQERAIQLLSSFLKNMREKKDDDEYPTKEGVAVQILKAQINSDAWKDAEKFIFANKALVWQLAPLALGRVAMLHAESGNTDEAVRIWKIKINLDRRETYGLSNIVYTKAKKPIADIYLLAKKDDPNMTVPDLALQLLK